MMIDRDVYVLIAIVFSWFWSLKCALQLSYGLHCFNLRSQFFSLYLSLSICSIFSSASAIRWICYPFVFVNLIRGLTIKMNMQSTSAENVQRRIFPGSIGESAFFLLLCFSLDFTWVLSVCVGFVTIVANPSLSVCNAAISLECGLSFVLFCLCFQCHCYGLQSGKR